MISKRQRYKYGRNMTMVDFVPDRTLKHINMHENGLISIHGCWKVGCRKKILSATKFCGHNSIFALGIKSASSVESDLGCTIEDLL